MKIYALVTVVDGHITTSLHGDRENAEDSLRFAFEHLERRGIDIESLCGAALVSAIEGAFDKGRVIVGIDEHEVGNLTYA